VFVCEKEIEVNGGRFRAEKFIISVGSSPNVPPIEGIREVGYYSYNWCRSDWFGIFPNLFPFWF